MMILLATLIVLVSFLYYFVTKNHSYWKSKNVPFDKPFLFFGSMYKTFTGKEHFSETFRRIYKEHTSPYVGFYFFNSPLLMIRSPEMIKKILVKDFDKFTNRLPRFSEKSDPLSFHNLAFARDSTWKNLRVKMSPVFTSGKLKLMFPLMKECGDNLRDCLEKRNGQIVEMENIMKRYSVDVISSCAFGFNSNCLKRDNPEMLPVATALLDFNSIVRNFSFFCFQFAPKLVRLLGLTFLDSKASKYLVEVFKDNLEQREKLDIVRNDLVDCLRNMKKQESLNEDYKFDDLKMAAQALLFFTAGSDTTTLTLTFALHEIALNQEIQQRLRQEIRKSFDEDGDFTYESVQNIKYLDMVLSETLRKHPLTIILSRIANTDYVFEETGLKIEKDTNVFISLMGLHYDEKYFPNPEKFDPERFSDENKGKIPPYTYMPFGDGPRICIGQRFANQNSKVALCYILKDFAIELTEDADIPIKFVQSAFVLKPKGGVRVKLTKL